VPNIARIAHHMEWRKLLHAGVAFGRGDSKLRDLLPRFPNVNVSVESTTSSPGKHQDFASELLASDPAFADTSGVAVEVPTRGHRTQAQCTR
jgi:hypothetical protein